MRRCALRVKLGEDEKELVKNEIVNGLGRVKLEVGVELEEGKL